MLGTTPSEAINPEMVILARESRGMTQHELAEQIGATQGHVSKIESGAIAASEDIVMRLSEALQYPPGFFSQTDRIYGPSVSEFFHRKRAVVSMRLLCRIHAQANIRRIHINRLARSTEIIQKIPHYDPEEFRGDVEEIARAVRALWQMPRGPVKDVVSTIENAGGVIIRLRFDTNKIDALSWWVPGSPPIFLVNDSMPADRERLTLCHELGHIVMHSDVRPNMEEEANRFAAAFLMPTEDIRAHLADSSMHKLAGLKTRWKVSMQALLVRAEQTNAITPGKTKSLWVQLSRAGYRTREPAELDFPKEQAGLMQELVDFHCEKLGYDQKELADLFKWTEREVLANYSVNGQLPGPKAALRVLK